MDTVASERLPEVAAAGSVPNDSLTFSPDSARLSSTAEKSKVLDVSPASKVTLCGTPL